MTAIDPSGDPLSPFIPRDGVDYGWVAEYAKAKHEDTVRVFDILDDKATAIVNALTAGAGVFTLGSLAGVAAAKVPPTVIWWALPSMLSAVAAVVLATLVRIPWGFHRAGPIKEAVAVAEHYRTRKKAERAGATLTLWADVDALNAGVLVKKSNLLWWANVAVIAAVGLLLLPLIASLVAGSTAHAAAVPTPPPIPATIP